MSKPHSASAKATAPNFAGCAHPDLDEARQRLEITYMLVEATRLTRAAFDNRVRAIGLTGATVRALFALAKEDGLSQIELARRLDVSRMAMGQTIDRLEKSGHVERRPDPVDRRVWRLHLTPAADDLLPPLAQMAIEQQALILENLSETEVDALKQSLRKITERLRSMPIQLLTEDDPIAERDSEMRDAVETHTDEKPTIQKRLQALTKERAPLMIIGSVVIVLVFATAMLLSGGREKTENAYVQASRAPVAASISGRVIDIRVHDNQVVEAGQTLFVLEGASAEADLQEADAALSAARAHAGEQKAQYEASVAAYRAAQDSLAYARTQSAREQALEKEGLSAKQQVEGATFAVTDAQRNVERARQTMAAALAVLGGDASRPLEDFPEVREAAARVQSAQVDVDHTVIKALQPGIVTRVDQIQVGSYVTAGQPLFWMVAGEPWIEANFKENQLEHMRIGQEATVKLDSFPDYKLKARVMSFSPGTGAVFSAIPAQNATGNWVKVVQRLPVRLKLINPPSDVPISAGLSAQVMVNTRSGGAALRGRN